LRRAGPALEGRKPEIVIGPAIGGIVIAYEPARSAFRHLRGREGLKFSCGAVPPRARHAVIVAEDVVTTGGSAGEVVALARSARARPSA
jgi:orotate phosphoribosyltransferase